MITKEEYHRRFVKRQENMREATKKNQVMTKKDKSIPITCWIDPILLKKIHKIQREMNEMWGTMSLSSIGAMLLRTGCTSYEEQKERGIDVKEK